MKIAFNPSTVAALTTPPNNKDITFDLKGHSIFARGVEFKGTDTNTWRDIKINNVSIGSHTLDLRNGSNTTLTNTNGVVTINSTWRPVVDNLTSDSTTSSLSAKQGKVLKALIDGKSNSDHNHDGRYLRLSGQDTMQGNLYLHSHGTSYIGKGLGDKSGADFTEANIVISSWWGISFKSYDDIVRTYIDTRTGNIGTKGVLNAVGAVIQGRIYNDGDDEGIIINPASNGQAGLILGTHNGERSVFYLKKGYPFWRYNNGSTNLDIYHPKKSGTIALTSDIPDKNSWNYDDRYLRLTGGWMSGDINFGGDNKICWERNTDSASISFKNDEDGDANSYMSFVTSDNGNEYFRWSHNSGSTNTEWMALRSDGLRVRGTKVSLEGHSHNDLYYTKVESNAKYITDIATSVNKLTFTRNGSNIIRDITVNVVHSQGQLPNIPNKDATTKANPGLLIYDSYNQTIGTNLFSSVLSINTGGTIQIAGNWGDDQTRNLYWRSQSDRNVADYPWKSWRTILDSENYSSTLDSRYYTESEVNSLLDAKLNRQNLSYGNWNPRGWNLAADYHYNGGDLSISENNGKMYVSVDGCFWQNEGQYRVLDTSDIGDIRDSVTLHQYLTATDAAWYPLVWGGSSHNNTSDSTGPIYKSYDKLSWQTSSQTLYATHLRTTYIDFENNGGIFQVTSGGTSPYKGIRLPDLLSNGIGMFSQFGSGYSADEGGVIISADTSIIYNSFDTGWGLTVRDKDRGWTDISGDGTIAFGVRQDYRAYSLGGFEKAGSDNSYVLLGGGGHTLLSSLNGSHNHDGRYVRAFGTSNDNINSDWGQSFKTFDPIPSGTPPEQNPNISILNIGENFNKRKQLAFIWNNDNIYYRRHTDSGFTNWRRLAFTDSKVADSDKLDGEHASSFVRAGHYEGNDLNKLDTYSFIRSVNSNVSSTSPKGNTGWYNVIQLVHRNGAADGPSYIGQIALGMSTNTNDMFFRGKRTDPWKTVIHSGNYTEFINNYYWANVKISTSSSTTTSPTFSNVYLGNSLQLNNRGSNSIYNGPNDSTNGVGGPLNNLVFSSWYGVSFTTSCAGLTYTNKTAVSINCRTGQLYAREVQANGFMHTGHNNNDAVLLAGGGYKTLKDFIFLNKSYNYTDTEHYNLAFHKLSGICNNLVWVDGHVKGFVAKFFVIDPAVLPYQYDNDLSLNTIYLMTGNNYITINAMGIVIINNATDHEQRVGFFYTGRA